MPVKLRCLTCRKTFFVPPSKSSQKFCSTMCYPRNGPNNPKWRGGVMLVGGYVYQYAPHHPHATNDGYVCQHRLVMEKTLGRLLKKGETVHHKNEDKTDNRPGNLQLCSSNGRHTIDCHRPPRGTNGRFLTWGSSDSNGRVLTFQGVTLNVVQWADKLGLTTEIIRARLRKGKPIEQILGPRIRKISKRNK